MPPPARDVVEMNQTNDAAPVDSGGTNELLRRAMASKDSQKPRLPTKASTMPFEFVVRKHGTSAKQKKIGFALVGEVVHNVLVGADDLSKELADEFETIDPICLPATVFFKGTTKTEEANYLNNLVSTEGRKIALNLLVTKNEESKFGFYLKFTSEETEEKAVAKTVQDFMACFSTTQKCPLLPLDPAFVATLLTTSSLLDVMPDCLAGFKPEQALSVAELVAGEPIEPKHAPKQPAKRKAAVPKEVTSSLGANTSASAAPAAVQQTLIPFASTKPTSTEPRPARAAESSVTQVQVYEDEDEPDYRNDRDADELEEDDVDSGETLRLEEKVAMQLSRSEVELLEMAKRLGKRTISECIEMNLQCEITKSVGGGVARLSHSTTIRPYDHPTKKSRNFFESY